MLLNVTLTKVHEFRGFTAMGWEERRFDELEIEIPMRICLSSQHNSSSRVAVGELRELREKANDTEGKVIARALMKDKSSEFEFSVVVHCSFIRC